MPADVWACVIDCELVAADARGVVQPFRDAVRLTKAEGATDDATAGVVHLPAPSVEHAAQASRPPPPPPAAADDTPGAAGEGLHLLAVAFDVLLINDDVLLARAVRCPYALCYVA